jgi:hypothetical protein
MGTGASLAQPQWTHNVSQCLLTQPPGMTPSWEGCVTLSRAKARPGKTLIVQVKSLAWL